MKSLSTGVFILICLVISENLSGQQLNGDKFCFPKGKTEWSDTIFKKLRTKQMVKENVGAVLLAIRYKIDKEIDTGKWYKIEITNKSAETKVKFKVKSGRNQEVFTVKLNPGQTRIIQKFYWKVMQIGPVDPTKEDSEHLFDSYSIEDLLER